MNTDELKALARLTKSPAPTRKDELTRHILEYLAGDRLRTVWQYLDDIQKAAVAEVVHSTDSAFTADRFRAKYGRLPNFGTASRGRTRDEGPTPLRFFFYGSEQRGCVMPDDLKERLRAFVPPPVEGEVESAEQLPPVYDRPFEHWNPVTKQREHRTEPISLSDLEQGDLLALDAYAVRVSDLVWRLEAGKLLSATEEGRSVDETREFLSRRSDAPLPDTVRRLLDDASTC